MLREEEERLVRDGETGVELQKQAEAVSHCQGEGERGREGGKGGRGRGGRGGTEGRGWL